MTGSSPLQRHPDPRTSEPAVLPDPEVEAVVRRYAMPVRREVRRMIRSSDRLADLARVFPGAVYALAIDHGPLDCRLEALDLVGSGAALKLVSDALGLPFWLRRLPPEAFVGPIPRLPSSDSFSRRVANVLPRSRRSSALWLQTVAFAERAAGEEFAIWLARQPVYEERGSPERLFAVLAAYAWFSLAPSTRAYSLIVVPWRPEIALDTALCAAKSWLNRLRLVLQLKPGVIRDTWFPPGESMGFSFAPLRDDKALLEEASAMHNCADQYAERIARDKCRLFSVQRRGRRVATLEIAQHTRELGVLDIAQLKARGNLPAPREVWAAAHAWLASQPSLLRSLPLVPPERLLDQGEWTALMRPYREQTGASWLPERLTPSDLATLGADMADLARRSGVTSWLFTCGG